ncbi:MAG: hypothetical protein IPL92_05780 [Saprospiraceae bacterium]|nr:hypothetical protein [Candidatus Opimibacter iunctus]
MDIADYLIKRDWRLFRNRHQATAVPVDIIVVPKVSETPLKIQVSPFDDPIWDQIQKDPVDIELLLKREGESQSIKREDWTKEIEKLDEFYSSIALPSHPIQLTSYTRITNIKGFITANLEVARAQNGNPTYRPYLNRVIELMKYLQENK